MKLTEHHIASSIGIVLGIVLIGVVIWWSQNLSEETPEVETNSAVANIAAEPEPVKIEARWLLAGEIFWGRQMEKISQQQDNPESYLFSKLDTLEREQYDAWLGHMECPIANKIIPFDTQANDLIFNCRPSYVPELAKWFNAVSLANNHSDNVDGLVGLTQTRQNLEKNGVQYYGHYDNSVTDDICEVVSLPVRVILSDNTNQNESLPVALCGYNNVFRLPTKAELDVISRYSERFLTIISPQQGAEYQPIADEYKQQIYRAMIDRGADMVIASHPHWVQNSEVYKGKLIMYSVGNFMFDQEWSEEVKRGVAVDLTLSLPYEKILDGWLSFDCSEFKDGCLEGIDGLKLAKLNFDLEFELVSAYHEDGLTRKAPNSIHKLNLKRTNWAETSNKLH